MNVNPLPVTRPAAGTGTERAAITDAFVQDVDPRRLQSDRAAPTTRPRGNLDAPAPRERLPEQLALDRWLNEGGAAAPED